ncbi:ABC transporter ATP-binding protein [Allosphingosinicella deserti]|uniref:ABC transporter ATP-binding protein n=1 Tax=Allosphingosinicella deserti TaxID=2116704 RepID=A0A2P7QZ69_9SPHN|nr:ABC transporter ATP-binding protein [Sphingomonas deserti]PSJ43254.1 ABC transporter ATP-binding protein [Sphingomonas deserti]
MLSSQDPSAAAALRTLYRQLSRSRRRSLWLLLIAMFAGAAAEMLTLGAVLAFLEAAANPDGVLWLQRALAPLLRATGLPLLPLAAGLLAIVAIGAGCMRLLLTWLTQWTAMAVGHDLGTAVFSRMLRQPYSQYLIRSSSERLSGMEKVHRAAFNVLLPTMQGVVAAMLATGIILFFVVIDPVTIFVASFAIIATYAAIAWATAGRLRRNSAMVARLMTERTAAIQQGLGGIRDILLEGSQPVFESRFAKLDALYRRGNALHGFMVNAPRYVVETAGIIILVIVASVLSARPGGLSTAIPALGAMALGAQRLLPLAQQAYFGWGQSRGNLHSLLDALRLSQLPILEGPLHAAPEPLLSDIVFDRVSFNYADGRQALQNICVTIEAGARIGITGPTGSGKSSFLDLLMGLLAPGEGEIRIDGRLLDATRRAGWQANLAHVPQTIFLSDDTITANIAFGAAPDAIDMDRVRWAASIAEVDGFVRRFDAGYDTLVGERGVRLSGGQRQRIGLARALYRNAGILILDEATSALDEKTEAAIMNRLAGELPGVTLIIVAHRASSLAPAERILFFEEGHLRAESSAFAGRDSG